MGINYFIESIQFLYQQTLPHCLTDKKGYYIDSIIKLLIQENPYNCGETSLKTLKTNYKNTVIYSLQLLSNY